MKLVLVVNQKARPPRRVHVFHVLAGTVVSARSVCGHVRPEGQVRTVVPDKPAAHAEVGRYNFHLEGDAICESCSRSAGFTPPHFGGIRDPRYISDPEEIKQLRW